MPRVSKARLGLLVIAGIAAIYCGARGMAAAADPSSARHLETSNPEQSSGGGVEKPSSLDFQEYRTRVEPIFLKERPGHARCYGCHSEGNRLFHLEKLSAGRRSGPKSNRAETFKW